MSMSAWVLHSLYRVTVGNVRRIAEEVLFESTRKTIAVALSARTLSESVEVLRTAAWSGNNEFWLDMMILSSAVLVTFAITVCSLRCFSWFCIGLPRAAHEVREIQAGVKPYQVAAVKERAERRARIEGGLEEKPVTVAEDMARLSKMMAAAQAKYSKPKRGNTSTTTSSSLTAAKGKSGNGGGTESKKTITGEATSTTAQATSETFSATRRVTPPATCVAVLRGFPEVNLLLTSPAQKYLLVGCRSKRKTMLYSQSDARLGQGKMNEVSGASVEETVRQAMRHETRVEIYSAAFTTDDTRLLVGERASDTFFVLSVQAASNTQTAPTLTSCLRQFTLQRRRLVSSLPPWGVVGNNALICFYDKDCEIEVIDYSEAAVTSSRHRFKVGNALAWAQRDAQVFAAGSFLREPRRALLSQRSTTSATATTGAGGKNNNNNSSGSKGGEYVLETDYIFPNPQKLRVLAMALVTRGTPAFNTRNYLIVFFENGNGAVYDLDTTSTSNTVATVCGFTDTDYAGYRPGEPSMRLIVAVSGQAYQERITLGLVRGAGVTVLRQHPNKDGATWQFERVADLRDVQEGDEVKEAVLLQQGRLLATCGVADGRHVRFFAVPSTDG